MCGILFVKYKHSKNHEYLNSFFEIESNKYLKTRGPTYQDLFKCDSFFAYQSVLAIQSNEKKSNTLPLIGSKNFLLYNGEIFGLSKSRDISDTDYLNNVLFKEKDLEESISKLDGMFIISKFIRTNTKDINANIYRDPIGEKHLWYFFDNEIFIISSVPAIITSYLRYKNKLQINKEVIEDYLVRRHLISPEEHSFKGIKQLKPGHKLIFKSEDWFLKEKKYFNYEKLFSESLYEELSNISQQEFNERFLKLINQTIELMEDCRPINNVSSSIVSGGFDSSIVSAFLYEQNKNRDLYTMIFDKKDPVAINVPNLLKSRSIDLLKCHKQISCKVEDYHKRLLRTIDILSSPINTHSIPSAYLVAEKASDDKNIILYGGEGADEVFLGYDSYNNFDNISSKYNQLNNNFNFDKELKKRVQNNKIEKYIFDLKSNFYNFLDETNLMNQRDSKIKAESFVDIIVQLSNVGLITTDTTNSDLGIESRTPFTRRKMVEFGISSPVNKLIDFSNSKPINKIPIRNAFKTYFSEDLIMQKIGFAGFPNETKKFLGDSKNWLVWDHLSWQNSKLKKMNLAEEWKIINLEWFLRKFD